MLNNNRNLIDTLKGLKKDNITRLQPSFVLGIGFQYKGIGIEKFEEQIKFLENLENMGIVHAKEGIPILRCNFCSNFNFSVRFNCVYCNSPDIVSGVAIEHDICHNVDFEDKFLKSDGSLKCEKCGRDLNAVGVDYSKMSIFKCKVCNGISSKVEQQYTCLSCGKTLLNTDVIVSNLVDYLVSPSALSSYIDELEYLNPIVEELDRIGIKSVFPAVETGVSGTHHSFDLIAYDNFDKPILILETLESVNDTSDNRENMVLSFIGKCTDFKVGYKILISLSELPKYLANLLEINNIIYMKIHNREESSLDIVQMIAELFNNAIEETIIRDDK
jgi:Thaumarchaeal output domain 1